MINKNTIRTAMAALIIGALSSCDGKIDPLELELPPVSDSETQGSLVTMTFSASKPEGLAWKSEDRVAIYDGVAKREFTVAHVKEDGKAVLEGQVAEGAEQFHAVWPYAYASEALPVEGKISVNIPAIQNVAENAVSDPDAVVCIGQISDGTITFESAVSHIKVNIPEEVKSVSVKGLAYENIAGNAASVVLQPSGETFKAGQYRIAVIPQTFKVGYKVVYVKEGYQAVAKVVPEQDADLVLAPGQVYDITEQTVADAFTWLANPIMTEAQLLEYLANQQAYASEVAKLGADITLTGTWTPVELTGTLDGQGHVISGLNVTAGDDAGMFSVLTEDAALKNMTVEGSISLDATKHPAQAGLVANLYGTMYKVVSKVSVTASSQKGACYVGGLVGQLSEGSLIECENHGNLTLGQTHGKGYVGGAVGVIYPAGLVDKCVNTGTIVSESSEADGIGGLTGLQQGGDVKGCVNQGKLVVNAGRYSCHVGGIVGNMYNYSAKTTTVSRCVNEGQIELGAPSIQSVGGVVGSITDGGGDDPSPAEVSECENKVAVSVQVAKTNAAFSGGETGLDGFYLGGIVGSIYAPNESQIVNIVKDCRNTGNMSAYLHSGAGNNNAVRVGGICGNVRGPVAIERNENAAESVTLESRKAHKMLSSAGGIIAEAGDPWNTEEETVFTLTGNINRASVLSKVNSTEAPAGGLIGYLYSQLSAGSNKNFGNVERALTEGDNPKLDECYAGGLVGMICLSAETRKRSHVDFSGDMTFGDIISVGRAGIFMGGQRSNSKGDMKFPNCVLSGRLVSPSCSYDIVMNDDNWDDKNSDGNAGYLWSYAGSKGNYGLNIDGVKYGEASVYDK